jgi:hypothetical protein
MGAVKTRSFGRIRPTNNSRSTQVEIEVRRVPVASLLRLPPGVLPGIIVLRQGKVAIGAILVITPVVIKMTVSVIATHARRAS